MDASMQRKICQLVAGIIIVDDILHDKEDAFLERVVKRLGIDEPWRDVIFPLVDQQEAAKQIKELPAQAQEEALWLLLEAACADGEIAPEERAYLHAIARSLGIREEELDRRLARHFEG